MDGKHVVLTQTRIYDGKVRTSPYTISMTRDEAVIVVESMRKHLALLDALGSTETETV